MRSFWIQYQVGLVGFLAVCLLIVLSNLRALRRLGRYPLPDRFPSVSVLLPVRDEAENVGPCVRSLLAQDYADLEVLVLDDGSTDGTGQVLASLVAEAALAGQADRLRVLETDPSRGTQATKEPALPVLSESEGSADGCPLSKGCIDRSGQVPLPCGWLGKHWACHQLAQAARGAFLLFTDADTRHGPYALRDAVAAAVAEGADMLTALPREEVLSWAERLIVPIFQWGFFTFLPLALAHRLSAPGLSAAVGQFMLFRRAAYEAIGGYAAVRGEVAEDMRLAQRIKARGLRWRLVDGAGHIRCRMYRGWAQVIEGFSKNLFAVFGHRLLPFLFVWLWTWAAFWVPLAVWASRLAGARVSALSPGLAGAAVVESLLLWGLFYWRFGLPLYLTLLYPLTTLLFVAVAMRSLVLTLAGRTAWKGRAVIRQRVRWW